MKKMTTKLSLSEFLEFSTNETTLLPTLPTLDQLKLIRKGLRKKKLPDFSLLPTKFEYDGVGKFVMEIIDSDYSIEWKTDGSEIKKSSFNHLCVDSEKELDRLEFGWMIADFARLDGINHLRKIQRISNSDYHQDLFNKEYALQLKHFQGIENVWRHWAIVPANQMLFGK
jgi:hypothetical protein